ncbi:LCP family protein [Erysipelothrix enhydrae]|uniref:LCP family glycopolymer transferase n=1 Tax=Erysipelothrix enhydrae TaxID=2890314 RepID=UPI002B251D64|nr:LCP family protein [Erysipelothrix sp. 4322-04]WRB87417.1 LCP family protein [Erysipelothrix sp. 4322-04]
MAKSKKQQTKTKQRRPSFIHRPIFGLFITVVVNIIYIALLFVIGRYVNLHSKYFMLGITIIVLFVLVLNLFFLLGYAKRIRFFRKAVAVFGMFMLIIGSVGSYYTFKTNAIANQMINETGQENKEFSVISFKEGAKKEDLDHSSLGYVETTQEFEDAVKKNVAKESRTVEYVKFKSYDDLLIASLNNKIQFAVVPKNFSSLSKRLETEDRNPIEFSKAMFSFSIKSKETVNDKDVLKEPFTMLMIGVNEELADSIILTSFNPETLKITMTSIPRDSYLPIACQNNYPDKITHARAFSRQCLIDSIQDFMGVNIDFYFETDFYALVKIVDTLGGLELESPIAFGGSLPKEEDPTEFHEIWIPAGKQKMDGKQVITFARERYAFTGGDYVRQMNQQYVIKELANQILSTRNVNTLVNVLDAAKDNIQMNISINDITSLMGYALQNIEKSPVSPYHTFRIVSTQLQGEGEIIDDGYSGKYVSHPYMRDVQVARDVISDNLKHDAHLLKVKSFGFKQSKPYRSALFNPSQNVDGLYYPGDVIPKRLDETEKENETETSNVVPDLTSMSRSEIKRWAQNNGVTVVFNDIDQNSESYQDYYSDGQVIYQSVEPGDYHQKQSYIELTIVVKSEIEEPKGITIPDFVGDTVADAIAWANGNGFTIEAIPSGDTSAIIESQSIRAGLYNGEHRNIVVSVRIESEKPENQSPNE